MRMRATRSASPCSPSVPAAGLEWDYTREMPEKIPVVEQDFIFSAIAEEMGGIFAICLI